VAAQSRYAMDFTQAILRAALAEIIGSFPVYRTYVTERSESLPSPQQAVIHQAIGRTKTRNPDVDPRAADFIGSLLLLRFPEDFAAQAREQARRSVMRLQQLTGPVMAKGLEDTAFYRFNRLVSLTEVS